jgi:phosphatidylinositol-bisphosphatase/inositol-1,4,5-trisphosphate 5-phosphatase
MGIVGNKGGIGISVSINEKIFLFANSHLESGQNAEPKR